MLVRIPFFDRFRQSMLASVKTMTSRNKKYGSPGDIFKIFRATFQITKIEHLELGIIAKHYYKEEGVDSPEEFINIWKRLHPGRGWRPDQVVYLHQFKRT